MKNDAEEVRRLYNIWGPKYSKNITRYKNVPRMRKLVTDLLGDVEGKKILYAGCGDGTECISSIRKGGKVFGIDISDNRISMAKQQFGNLANFERMDIKKTRFRNSSFDYVVSVLSLMYEKDIAKPLQEFKRLIKKKGSIIVVVPHPIRKMMKYNKGNYFVKGKKYETWKGVRRFNYYHLFEDYIESFTRTKLRLVKLIEPKPLKENRESAKYPRIALFVLKK